MEAFGNQPQMLANTIPQELFPSLPLPPSPPPPLPQGLPQNCIRLRLKIKEGLATSEAIWLSSKVHFLPQIPCFCLLT